MLHPLAPEREALVNAKRLVAACIAALIGLAPAHAIIMRHDVDQSRYLVLGHEHSAGLVNIALVSRDGSPLLFNGMGTLIAPNWVLTAAHVAQPLAERVARGPHYVFVKGRGYRVAQVIIHPGYDPNTVANDIALVRLESPVRNPEPVCLYEGSDELGKVVILVGSGVQGDGATGPLMDNPDGALRGATSTVTGVRPSEIEWVFRAPDAGATPLEGISGPGDSGGPALIEANGRTCIAGVSSYQRSGAEAADPNAGPLDQPPFEGHFGVVEVYMRVSHYLPWIRSYLGAG